MIRNTIMVNALNRADSYVRTLTLDDIILYFDYTGGTDSFTIIVADDSQDWTLVQDYYWFTVSATSGDGDTVITVTCSARGPNPHADQEDRSGTITVSSDYCKNQSVTIYQDARP
jgi:hypothetical protein